MTIVVATGVVFLPFALNVCGVGPTIAPMTARVEEANVIIRVPDSMTDGAIGKSIYPSGYAWWVVDRLNVEASSTLDEIGADIDDTRRIRDILLEAAQVAVRRFLNAYRWRLNQPQVHPVKIEPAQFLLETVHEDGTRDSLPEPLESFFYKSIPADAPLDTSVNTETMLRLQRDVLDGIEPPHSELFALDMKWLESIGEVERAKELGALRLLPE